MTGKTDTVGTVGSKLSGIDHSETMKKAKMSQFCAEKKWEWLLLPFKIIAWSTALIIMK